MTMKPLGRMLAKIMHAAPLAVAEQLIRQVGALGCCLQHGAWRGQPGSEVVSAHGCATGAPVALHAGMRCASFPSLLTLSLYHAFPSGHGHARHGDVHC